jgi:hypothetical protein
MTELMRLAHLSDPDAPARLADAFGQPMGAVYATDLDDWAWVIEHLDAWLTNANAATRSEYAAFVADRYGPGGGPTLAEVCSMLSAISFRMRVLASEEGS